MMRTLIYSMGVSLDGFIAGPEGEIDWSAPDEELMRFHNEQTRELGAQLSGRRLYEDMLPWETAEQTRSDPLELEFARHPLLPAPGEEDGTRTAGDADVRLRRRLPPLPAYRAR